MLLPNEYDASYFDGNLQPLKHNAGYSKYERWYRNEGAGSTGEFWKDKAQRWVNHLALANKKVLELACAKGFVVEDLVGMGVDAYGFDVSPYCVLTAPDSATLRRPDLASRFTVGDVRTGLNIYANKEFDVVISFRLLECLTDAEVEQLAIDCKRIGKTIIHVVSSSPNPTYYNQHTLQEWLNFGWPKGTIIAPYGNEFNYLTK